MAVSVHEVDVVVTGDWSTYRIARRKGILDIVWQARLVLAKISGSVSPNMAVPFTLLSKF